MISAAVRNKNICPDEIFFVHCEMETCDENEREVVLCTDPFRVCVGGPWPEPLMSRGRLTEILTCRVCPMAAF